MIGLPLHVLLPPARMLVWPLLFGLGAYLLLTAQPIGKPKPNLRERLDRLDVDERLRRELAQGPRPSLFASPRLEALLRPALDDGGRLLASLLGRAGLGGEALDRRLAIVRPGVDRAHFFAEKLVGGLLGLALCPAMQLLGIHPFGSWPLWAWLAGGVLGFLWSDWRLEAALVRRRTRVLLELPAILDLLTIAVSAGQALEQALLQVTQEGNGVVAIDFQQATRQVALGQRTLAEALDALARRCGVPELAAVVAQLGAAHEQGTALAATLAAQADAVREARRLRILEAGGKASVKMLLPVACFILPVLFVVILAPAGAQLVHLGG